MLLEEKWPNVADHSAEGATQEDVDLVDDALDELFGDEVHDHFNPSHVKSGEHGGEFAPKGETGGVSEKQLRQIADRLKVPPEQIAELLNRTVIRLQGPTAATPTPEQARFVDNKPHLGQCYDSAARYMMDHAIADRYDPIGTPKAPQNIRLVHGTVSNPGYENVPHKLVAHAWVDLGDGKIFDGALQKFYEKDSYYKYFNAKEEQSYTHDEMIKAMSKDMHYGPWGETAGVYNKLPEKKKRSRKHSFPDHEGRPGHIGGSLPRTGGEPVGIKTTAGQGWDSSWYSFPSGGDWSATALKSIKLNSLPKYRSPTFGESNFADGGWDWMAEQLKKQFDVQVPEGEKLVFRLGSEAGGLENRNAADLNGLVRFLSDLADPDKPGFKSVGDTITAYAVKIGKTGEYKPLTGAGRKAYFEEYAEFDPAEHPRHPAGAEASKGGEFAPKGAEGAGEKQIHPAPTVSDDPRPYFAHIKPPPSNRELDAEPNAAGMVGTEKEYRDEKTLEWDPEREAWHQAIMERYLEGKNPEGTLEATVLGGGQAVGKTTISRQVAGNNPNLVRVDADEIKLLIPEYEGLKKRGGDLAASLVHEESSYIAKLVLAEAAARGLDVVYDATSSGKGGPTMAKSLHDRGYKVHLAFADVPISEARRRANARATDPTNIAGFGRRPPPGRLEESHHAAAANFLLMKDMPEVETAQLFSTDVPLGDAPKLVYSRTGRSNATILDNSFWDRYVLKAERKAE